MRSVTRRTALGLTAAAGMRPKRLLAGVGGTPSTDLRVIREYLRQTAPQLLRPAMGGFRYPSVASSLPGREYSADLWDWDTLWTCRGLLTFAEMEKNAELHAAVLEQSKGSLRNFLDRQSPTGRVPILMTDRNPDLLGSTAADAPASANQAKPVFAQLAMLIVRRGGGVEWARPLLDPLLRFYAAWEPNRSACGLYVWGNDVAIGNDNDPTTFGRPFFSSANLLLNCLFHVELRDAAELGEQLGRAKEAAQLKLQADRLGRALAELCWDPRDRFFYTVDVQCKDRRSELLPQIKPGMAMSWQVLPLRVQTFTGFMPLWCGAATPEQAAALVAANYRGDDRLRCAFGVRSLSRLESMYSLAFSSNPSNWLGPVWVLANYVAWSGLKRYGYLQEADELAAKTAALLARDIEKNGSMNEYYHPDTGAALSHKGFMDWNLLVLEMVGTNAG